MQNGIVISFLVQTKSENNTDFDNADLVYNLLAWVLCGDCDGKSAVSAQKVTLSDIYNRLVISIAHDLLHCVSGGRVKTPKHVVLPLTVRHLTRSSQLVEILNHFGHSLSNSVIQEVETSMVERQIAQAVDGYVYIPPKIQSHVPVVMCWDNNDINEETLSGHGTTHCTNGIVIQRTVQQAANAPAAHPCRPRGKRKRSFTPQPCTILQYNAGQRCVPGTMAIPDDELRFPESPVSETEAQLKDSAWCILRCRNDNDDTLLGPTCPQVVPGWSGFNAAASKTIPVPSVCGYCPVIEASPTQLSTVYTLLKRSVQMSRKLGLE